MLVHALGVTSTLKGIPYIHALPNKEIESVSRPLFFTKQPDHLVALKSKPTAIVAFLRTCMFLCVLSVYNVRTHAPRENRFAP